MSKFNRNAYQREYRRQNKLLEQFLQNVSSDGEENNQNLESSSSTSSQAQVCDSLFENVHVDSIPNQNIFIENHYSDWSSDESSGSDCEGVLNLLREDIALDDVNQQQDAAINDEANFSTQMSEWILRNKINRTASNELLSILRQNGHEELPLCTRTLLKTPRNYTITEFKPLEEQVIVFDLVCGFCLGTIK